MTIENEINQLLLPLSNFYVSALRIPPDGLELDVPFKVYEHLLARMQEPRPLSVEETYTYEDDLYLSLMLLLRCYLAHLPSRLPELAALLSGSTEEELGLPLMREMAKGWPDNVRTSYRNFPPQFIRL
jgi:hypothetical protein